MQAHFFGQFLIKKGIISKTDFLLALEVQHIHHVRLGQLAIEHNMLQAFQVEDINKRQRSQNKYFGYIATERKLITEIQLTTLLNIQKEQNLLIGEILVHQNVLTHDNLKTQLQLHQQDCSNALFLLQKTMILHPLKSILSSSIDICNSLFLRVLQSKCHVRSVIDSNKQDITFEFTSHIFIYTENPIKIALACNEDCLVNIACTFVKMKPSEMDLELAQDVLGEFLNILLGQLLEEIHTDYGDLERSVPYLSKSPGELIKCSNQFLAVHMTSQLGDFALMVLDDTGED